MSFFDKEYVERTFVSIDWEMRRERCPNDYGPSGEPATCPICKDPANQRNHGLKRCHEVRAEKGLPPFEPEPYTSLEDWERLKEADTETDLIY